MSDSKVDASAGRNDSDGPEKERGALDMSEPLDVRLVPAALCCWGATVVGIVLGWRAGLGLAAVCAVAAGGLLWFARREESRRNVGSETGAEASKPRRGMVFVLLAAVVVGGGYAVAAAWDSYWVERHPLREHVRDGRVLVTLVTTDDAKALGGKGFGGRKVLVRGELVEFQRGGRVVEGGGAVLVLAPAARWRELLPGQRVTFRGKVDRPWRADLTVAVLRAEGAPVAVNEPPWWQRAAGRMRTDFAGAADATLSPDAAGLLPGLVIGDTSRLPEQVRGNFREVDLSHLTAVSGANITILLGAVLLSMRALTVDPRIGAVVAGVALVMFVVLARPSPSVLRAAVMGAVALLALCVGRRKQAVPALCTAVIGLLGWSPELAVDVGFALSVLATTGLIVLAPGWSDWLRAHGWWRAPADALAVSAAAFVVTTPVIVAVTGHLSLVGIAVNVLVEPVIAPITVLGAVGALLSCLWSPAAQLVLHCVAPPLWWLLTVSGRAAALGASVTLPTGLWSGILATMVCTLVVIGLHPRSARSPDHPGSTAG